MPRRCSPRRLLILPLITTSRRWKCSLYTPQEGVVCAVLNCLTGGLSTRTNLLPTPTDTKSDMPPSTAKDEHSGGHDEHAQELPKNRLSLVFIGLTGCSFLSALDQVRLFLSAHRPLLRVRFQTIVATALPTIVQHLGDGKNYSWVGTYVACYFDASGTD